MSCHVQYASLFIRLWKVCDSSGDEISTVWQSEVEHIQSGKSWGFNSVQDLAAFLQNLPDKADDLDWIELPGIDPPGMQISDGIEQISADGGWVGDKNDIRIVEKNCSGRETK